MAITINGSGITSANIADGTIVNADVNDVAASKLTGALPTSSLPTGAVLRVLFDTYATNFTTASTSWVDTGLTITLTPNSVDSKFYLQWNQQNYAATSSSTWEGGRFRVLRNGSAVWTDNYSIAHADYNGNTMKKLSDSWLDSPATTSSIVYKIQVQPYNANTHSWNHGAAYSQLTIMEVQG